MHGVELIYAPRAERDLLALPRKHVHPILSDHDLLRTRTWPAGKVKRLTGQPYWEIKSGDYRSLFVQEHGRVIFLRIVNRKDLEKTIKRIDPKALWTWLREKGG